MLRKLLFAGPVALLAASAAMLGAFPARADGYYAPVNPYVLYNVPYGYPAVAYSEVEVQPSPFYPPVTVRTYDIPQQQPYYNVPPYSVIAPY